MNSSIKRIKAARARTHWQQRHSYEREYKNADESEWAALLSGTAHISQGTRDAMMSEEALEQDGTSVPGASYMQREGVDEGLQASVREIVEERIELLGATGYPFSLDNNSLVFSGDFDHPYIALLTICNLPSLSVASRTIV